MSYSALYNKFDRFVRDTYRKKFSREQSIHRLNDAKANFDSWVKLTSAQKKEICEYWGIKKPVKSDFMTHEIMLNVKGTFDVRYVPEKIYRLYLDPGLANSQLLTAWDDKNYFERHQPILPFPKTFVRNINGFFLDSDYHLISKEEAKSIIVKNLPLIVKPTLVSGEGKNIRLISDENDVNKIFFEYDKNYLVQALIVPCDELKNLSAHSVSSIRIITAMVNGKPKLLTSHILCNTKNNIAVNDDEGSEIGVIIIKIDDEGKLSDNGYFRDARCIQTLPNGFSFGGLQIPSYKEVTKLVLEAHMSMPMTGFVGWDITINDNNKPVFFEWNMRGIEIYFTQLTNGPLFGEHSDYFAKISRDMIKKRNH